MKIRKSTESEKSNIKTIHTKAFGEEHGPEIAELVHNLFNDNTAMPRRSLVAVENGKLIGHILFTKVKITQPESPVSAQILAPLAILPEYQNQGVGKKLIKAGLNHLQKEGVQLVFVLGHPGYYPRCGFTPAGVLGYQAPYPIPDENADAWMAQELSPGIFETVQGKIKCAAALDHPEHWRE